MHKAGGSGPVFGDRIVTAGGGFLHEVAMRIAILA
jgi:hypothetical protein